LGKAEKAGFLRARHYRAVLKAKGIAGKRDWVGAIEEILPLAGQENPFALSQLGFLLLMTKADEHRDAAENLLNLAAFLGNPEARALMGGPGKKPALDPANLDLAKGVLQTPPDPGEVKPHKFASKPKIAVLEGVIPGVIADYIKSRALPQLKPSMVIDHVTKTFIQEDYRTSTELRFLPAQSDLVVEAVCARIAKLTDLPLENQEVLGVLRYEPGQEYKPHSDFLQSDPTGRNPEVERCGQRIRTFLIYLNEEFEGGETEFPKLGLAVKGKKGDALMFSTVTSDGSESPLALHAGLPVTLGEKFITTLWIRDKAFTFPLAGD
jgi:hypothetical protein